MNPSPMKVDRGFSLVELVIVIAVLGIMSAYAVMKSVSPAQISLPSQAQKLASDLHRAQTLAYTWEKRVRVTVTSSGANGTYTVVCSNAYSATDSPCSSVNDFSTTVQKGVSLAATVSPLDFYSNGKPSSAAGYTLTYGSNVFTICVAAVTGQITIYSSSQTCT